MHPNDLALSRVKRTPPKEGLPWIRNLVIGMIASPLVGGLSIFFVLLLPPHLGLIWILLAGAALVVAGTQMGLVLDSDDDRAARQTLRGAPHIVVLACVSSVLLILGVTGVVETVGYSGETDALSLYRTHIAFPFLRWIGFAIGMVVVIPLLEESIFRGRIQPLMIERWGVGLGIAGTALCFTVVHIGTHGWGDLAVPLTVGLLCGLVRVKFGSIWPPVVVHSTWNAIASLSGRIRLDPSSIYGDVDRVILLGVSIVLLAVSTLGLRGAMEQLESRRER